MGAARSTRCGVAPGRRCELVACATRHPLRPPPPAALLSLHHHVISTTLMSVTVAPLESSLILRTRGNGVSNEKDCYRIRIDFFWQIFAVLQWILVCIKVEMQRTPETDPSMRTGGAAPAWTQLPQLNAAVSPFSPAVVAPWWRCTWCVGSGRFAKAAVWRLKWRAARGVGRLLVRAGRAPA